mgnify:CR=1 FL=1
MKEKEYTPVRLQKQLQSNASTNRESYPLRDKSLSQSASKSNNNREQNSFKKSYILSQYTTKAKNEKLLDKQSQSVLSQNMSKNNLK